MARTTILLALLLGSLPAAGEEASGHLVLIGGGERPGYLMQRIVELAGGAQAHVLVVTLAHPEPGAAGADLVRELELAGAGRAEVLDLERPGADGWETHQRIEQASGIFLAGGDQARLAAALAGSGVLERVRGLYQRGGVVAGTSAGATALGATMVLGPAEPNQDPDRAITAIRAGSLALEPGLGLLPGVIVDQHFLARRRHNRLLAALLENPELLGVGIDEATAIVVGPSGRFEVVGEGLVAVYDLSGASASSTDGDGDLAASGIVMHLLQSGQIFGLEEREVER